VGFSVLLSSDSTDFANEGFIPVGVSAEEGVVATGSGSSSD
jgi:hypothetical protein